jgi:mannose-6-phosphate isomerase-like protein (cupin superfamily)
MSKMNVNNLECKLRKKYKNVYVWIDKPHKTYSSHYHRSDTYLIILEGAMQLTVERKRMHLKPGSRIEIRAYQKHEAVISPQGCTYLVREVNKR